MIFFHNNLQIRKGWQLLFCFLICLNGSFSIIRNVLEWQVMGKWIGLFIMINIVFIVVLIGSMIKSEYTIELDKKAYSISMCLMNIAVASYCLMQALGLLNNYSSFCSIADFDNPAGVASLLCVTFPFVFIFPNKNATSRNVAKIMLLIDVIVFFFIQSRMGLLTISVQTIIWMYMERDYFRGKKIWSVLLFIAIIGFSLLFIRKMSSTNGRFLILRICWKMIEDDIWLGHGIHGFAREYMLYQADFLKQIDAQELYMLTDNITHPLSEYVLVAINFGIIGLVSMLIISFGAFRLALKGNNRLFVIILFSGMALLSMFSYPFRYPMTFLALGCCFLSSGIDVWNKTSLVFKKMFSGIMTFVIIMFMTFFLSWYRANVIFSDAINMLYADKSCASFIRKNVLSKTDKMLIYNPHYLYSRAVIYFYAKDYDAAINDALNSSKQISNYNTELLLGSVFKESGQNDLAEMHYREASYMCPSRITPLYCLFRLYEELKDEMKMEEVGRELLSKPVKISSPETRAMRLDVKRRVIW